MVLRGLGKTSLAGIAKRALYKAGYYRARRRFAGPRENRLLVLMYHNLWRADTGRWKEAVDDDCPRPSHFEAHLREIAKRYRVVSLREAVAEILSRGRLEADSVAITFDDGNESFYTVAWPLLAAYNLPATVFLVPAWVESGRLPWWQHLCELVEKADFGRPSAASVEKLFGPGTPPPPSPTRDDAFHRRRFALGLEPLLRVLPDEERAEKLVRLQEILFPDGDFVATNSRVLTWQQIEEMARKGIDFESHTRTHIHIPSTDLSTIEKEICESKAEIEKHTGRVVVGFAYPFGKDLDAYVEVEALLRKHGFLYACTACPGTNSVSTNPYALRRYALPLTDSGSLVGREIARFFAQRPKTWNRSAKHRPFFVPQTKKGASPVCGEAPGSASVALG